MTINVTQDHIDKGSRGSCHGCPVALGIIAALGGESRVSVEVDAFDIGVFVNRELHTKTKTPESVRMFILAFDRQSPVSPFSFDLAIEAQS